MAVAAAENRLSSGCVGSVRAPQAIPWRRRSDLIVCQQDSGAWVVKDPLSLNYAMLNEQEMSILRMLDGQRSITDLVSVVQSAWPEDHLQHEDVTELVGQLIQNQLVVATSGQPPLSLVADSATTHRTSFFRFSSLLRMQFRLMDPTPLLDQLQPLTARLFSRQSAVLFSALALTAVSLIVLRFDQLVNNLPGPWDFFGPDNLLLLLGTFVFVKVMHEMGHALAAHRFGAECHEAGVMLMLFTPLLYTNVTDAWILGRRSRLMITAAGMLVELTLASAATVLWFFAAPGLVKALLTNVMVLCTVGTVLFNGNPLLRYDGYFLLTDAVGQPNLAQRATAKVNQLLENCFLGTRLPEFREEGWFVLAYGVCSGLYRITLTVAVLVMLFGLFDQWNLRIAGVILMVMAGFSMVVSPILSTGAGMLVELIHRPDRNRSALRAVILLLLISGSLFIPLPHSVLLPAVVEPAGIPVFATLSGRLASSARYGRLLTRDEPIAVLEDLSLQRQRASLNGDLRMQESRVRALELDRSGNGSAQLPEARTMLDAASKRLIQFEAELSRLTVKSPARGVLLPPRTLPLDLDEGSLSRWHGCPLDTLNRGSQIESATLLGYVCDPAHTEILLMLSNDEREEIREGQSARFQPGGNPDSILTGTIQKVASLEVYEIPSELTAAGLVAPLSTGRQSKETRRWQAVFQAITPSGETRPCLYSTGFVRVHVEPVSLAGRIERFFARVFE